MSIERKDKNITELQCDFCSNYEECIDFYDAVDFKKVNGWRSEKIGEDWFDKCTNCIEKEGNEIWVEQENII